MIKKSNLTHYPGGVLPLDKTNVFGRNAQHVYVNASGFLTDIVRNEVFAPVAGIVSDINSTGKLLEGDGTEGYPLDTSGVGPYFDAVENRWWLMWLTLGSKNAGPQAIFTDGAAISGYHTYIRTASPGTVEIECRANSATEFTDIEIVSSFNEGDIVAIASRITDSTDFACYVNGVQKHTATLSNQMGSKTAGPNYFKGHPGAIQIGTPQPYQGGGTIMAVGGGKVTNEDLRRWSLDPMSLFASSNSRIFFDVPASGGASIAVPVGSIELTGYAPSLNIDIAVAVGSQTLTGYAPTLNHDIAVNVGSLTITGYTPTLGGNVTVETPVGALTVTGYAPGLSHDIGISAGALTVTGLSPAVGYGYGVPVGSATITGYAPSLGFGPLSVAVSVGQLNLLGLSPSVTTTVDTGLSIRTMTADYINRSQTVKHINRKMVV